jgi:sirohydrochlorin ferrochelatase
MPPRVLFGARTSDPHAMADARPLVQHAREQGGRPVLHATIEAADGASCLRLARTVLFTHGAPPQLPGAGAWRGRGWWRRGAPRTLAAGLHSLCLASAACRPTSPAC